MLQHTALHYTLLNHNTSQADGPRDHSGHVVVPNAQLTAAHEHIGARLYPLPVTLGAALMAAGCVDFGAVFGWGQLQGGQVACLVAMPHSTSKRWPRDTAACVMCLPVCLMYVRKSV